MIDPFIASYTALMQTKQRASVNSGAGSNLDENPGGEALLEAGRPVATEGSAGAQSAGGQSAGAVGARVAASFRAAYAPDLRGDSRVYATNAGKPRGESRASFSAETWVAGPQAFLFRCQDPRRGDQWIFCVSRSTLEELAPAEPFRPAAAFDLLRARIHSAASARMRVADPLAQQVLSAYDIRYARTGARKDESKRQR